VASGARNSIAVAAIRESDRYNVVEHVTTPNAMHFVLQSSHR
jgi:hypothetical protein